MYYFTTKVVPVRKDSQQQALVTAGNVMILDSGEVYVKDWEGLTLGNSVPSMYERAQIIAETPETMAYPNG